MYNELIAIHISLGSYLFAIEFFDINNNVIEVNIKCYMIIFSVKLLMTLTCTH